MAENGIAWMIASGVRAQSAEDQRQQRQRTDLAHSLPPRLDPIVELRERLAVIVGGRSVESRLSADCCAA